MLLDVAFAVIGTSVPLFVVWTTVRSVNRRPNRKAIAWVATVLVLVVLYVLSFGPAYWWQRSSNGQIIPIIYAPLVETAWRSPGFAIKGLTWYACCLGYGENQRFGCSPLWRDGPRAFHWTSIGPSAKSPAPRLKTPPESN